jgi:hypothetical protein
MTTAYPCLTSSEQPVRGRLIRTNELRTSRLKSNATMLTTRRGALSRSNLLAQSEAEASRAGLRDSALVALGSPEIVGQVIAICCATPLNFVSNKLWTFRAQELSVNAYP